MRGQSGKLCVPVRWGGGEGLVKAIGLSNFPIDWIKRVLDVAKVPIANLQVSCVQVGLEGKGGVISKSHRTAKRSYGVDYKSTKCCLSTRGGGGQSHYGGDTDVRLQRPPIFSADATQ